MKIATVVGARPQFIKAAVVSRELRKNQEEIIVHTGQHFDHNMSKIFFEELDIPEPHYNLGISGGSHGQMTGKMLIKLDGIFQDEKPDAVLVYGDTNSTLAGALSAVKLHIPVIHVEAGVRLGTLDNPEEVNRILTDHVSKLLFCCTASAVEFLRKEGMINGVHLVGDPMYDAFLYYQKKIEGFPPEKLKGIDGEEREVPESYYYLTCHREENTAKEEILVEILYAMEEMDAPVIYPVHPRNRESVERLVEKYSFKNIVFCYPVGYLMSIFLVSHAKKIVTDSGGLQREAFFAERPCVTVFDRVIWPETMVNHRNQLAEPKKEDILKKLSVNPESGWAGEPFGDGKSAEHMVKIIGKGMKTDAIY